MALPRVLLQGIPPEKDLPFIGQRALRRLRVAYADKTYVGHDIL